MKELKTLKDWRKEICPIKDWEKNRMQIFRCEEWLKTETIKWVKEDIKMMESSSLSKGEYSLAESFIEIWKFRLNITEEK